MTGQNVFASQLSALQSRDRLRRLIPRAGLDFASNDYLALSGDALVARAVAEAAQRGVPVGSGGSRLLRGNAPEHEALEEKAARFFGAEAALYFSSGFAANQAILQALPQPGDLIVADALIHASAHEGMRLSRAAHVLAAHNDAQAFDDAITAWRAGGGTGTPWIVFETLYSMDGDVAPVAALAEVAQKHEAWLVADEAHATGVFGAGGRGLAASLEGAGNVVTLHTCGKAMGTEGALVCGSRTVIDYLVNKARPFIFSTAPSPLMAIAAAAAIDRIAAANPLRDRLGALVAHGQRQLCDRFDIAPTGTQILPVILGDDRRTMTIAAKLQAAGYDVRGIRPPTVLRGTSRLRLSLTLNVEAQHIDGLADALEAAMK